MRYRVTEYRDGAFRGTGRSFDDLFLATEWARENIEGSWRVEDTSDGQVKWQHTEPGVKA
jgi:hypothetical protein